MLIRTVRQFALVIVLILLFPLNRCRMLDLQMLADTEYSVSQIVLRKLQNLDCFKTANDSHFEASKFECLIDKSWMQKLGRQYAALMHYADKRLGVLNDAVTVNLFLQRTFDLWSDLAEMLHCCCPETLKQVDVLRWDKRSQFPSVTDIDDSARTIFALKDVYNLTVNKMLAPNVALQAKYSSPDFRDVFAVRANDLFEIGNIAFIAGKNSTALPWFLQALRIAEAEQEAQNLPWPQLNALEVIRLLPEMLLSQGNYEWAMHFGFILQNIPGRDANKAKKILKHCEKELKKRRRSPFNFGDRLPPLVNQREKETLTLRVDEYEALCRGETLPDPSGTSKESTSTLSCYLKRDARFLSIAPLKAEQLRLDPEITLFRNVISAAEAQTIIAQAKPKLVQSFSISIDDGSIVADSSYRASKSAWIEDTSEHPLLGQVTQRVQQMSNLDVFTMQHHQIVMYDLGGYYKPHNDFYTKKQMEKQKLQRLATVLIYLGESENDTDFEASYDRGGATVFPNIGLSILPTKYDAVLWYNIRRNGDGDERLLHAGCPLLAGTKWGRTDKSTFITSANSISQQWTPQLIMLCFMYSAFLIPVVRLIDE